MCLKGSVIFHLSFIVSMAIWITVSREAVKPSKSEINWRKIDKTLLSAGFFICIRYNHYYAFSKPAL